MGPSLNDVVEAVRAAAPPSGMTTKIVAVDGPGGAGKSTLAARLAEALGDVQVLPTDDFASWENPLEWWRRAIDEALQPLSRNQPARFKRTDWEKEGRDRWRHVDPAEYLVLEGVSASREAFQPFLTYSIWVETPRELRLSRGLERDGEEARPQWEQWMAEEDAYVERERPHERADVILRGDAELRG